MAQQKKRVLNPLEAPFVEIPNVNDEIDRTSEKFNTLVQKFKADTQGVLNEFNRKIRKQQPTVPEAQSGFNTEAEQFIALRNRQESLPRISESMARLEADAKSGSRDSSPIRADTSPSGTSLAEYDSSDDDDRQRDFSGLGGNGSKRKTKKRKHNLKKPWPTRNSRKRNGKGRRTRSHPRN
jgi:hypothetical protein